MRRGGGRRAVGWVGARRPDGVVLKQRSVGLDDRGRSTRWRTGGSCRGLLLLLVGVDGGAARLCCATRPCGC